MMQANSKVDKNSSHSKRHERQEDSDDDCDTNGCISERDQLRKIKNMNTTEPTLDGAKQKIFEAWEEIRHLREAVKIYRSLHMDDCCCVACGAFDRFCVENEDDILGPYKTLVCAHCGKEINYIPEDGESVCYMEHKRICEGCHDKIVSSIDPEGIT